MLADPAVGKSLSRGENTLNNYKNIATQITALLFSSLLLSSCGVDEIQNFECADLSNKSNIVSFTKKHNSAVFSSAVMSLCKKEGNISAYSDHSEGCKNFVELRKVGGTLLSFDDVIFTLDEKLFVGSIVVMNTYKCKRVTN